MDTLIKRLREFKRPKELMSWAIVLLTLGTSIAIAFYGYSSWQSYHNGNLEVLQSARPEPSALQADWANWYDLKAQQEMAEWAYSLLWVGIIGLATSIAGVGFILLNLRSLNEQNRIAAATGEAQTRPYLAIGPNVTLREIEANFLGRQFNLSFSIQNGGATPAVEPRISVVLYLDSEFTNPPDRENPLFVRVLDNRPTIGSSQEQHINLTVQNAGIPPILEPNLVMSFPTKDRGTDETRERISKDGSTWLCLEIFAEYTDIARTKTFSVGVEFESTGEFSFRRHLPEVNLSADRSLNALSISDSRLYVLNYNCPATWIFGQT